VAATGQLTSLDVKIRQQILPAGDASHGTPDPVLKRTFLFEFRQGQAQVDQTDYGHPGKMNPCYPQVIPTQLAPKTPLILAAAEALAALL
jgi:hypothetical protein